MVSWEIDRPTNLSSRDFDQICQVMYDAFDTHVLMRHELDEWSVQGVRASLDGLFEEERLQPGLILARSKRPAAGDEGMGEILGWLSFVIPGLPPSSYPTHVAEKAPGVDGVSESNAARPAIGPSEPTVPESQTTQSASPIVPAAAGHLEVSEEAIRRREWRREIQGPFNNAVFDRALRKPRAKTAYVQLIATSPRAQRSGIGKGLMEEAWKVVQEHGMGMALMTHMPSNVRWYQSLGYQVDASDELEVPGAGKITYTVMTRGVHH